VQLVCAPSQTVMAQLVDPPMQRSTQEAPPVQLTPHVSVEQVTSHEAPVSQVTFAPAMPETSSVQSAPLSHAKSKLETRLEIDMVHVVPLS
jgi:hypothetical protein